MIPLYTADAYLESKSRDHLLAILERDPDALRKALILAVSTVPTGQKGGE